jgi:hypothetical protein
VHELRDIISLVRSQCDPLRAPAPVDHGKRNLPFGGASGLAHPTQNRQTVAVLHQCVAHIAQLSRLAIALLVEPGLGIGRARMGLVRSLFLVEVALGIASRTVMVFVAAILPHLHLNFASISIEQRVSSGVRLWAGPPRWNKAATPDRAVRMAGERASANPHDCDRR